jgi:hypothetical protein
MTPGSLWIAFINLLTPLISEGISGSLSNLDKALGVIGPS